MTFLEKPLSVMFCKLTIFKINLLKLIKTLMGMHCNHFLCPLTYTKDFFFITIFPLIIFSIRHFFYDNHFHSFVNFKKNCFVLNFTCEHYLSYNIFDNKLHIDFFWYVLVMIKVQHFCFDIFEWIFIM
jgi:hypothetical protein